MSLDVREVRTHAQCDKVQSRSDFQVSLQKRAGGCTERQSASCSSSPLVHGKLASSVGFKTVNYRKRAGLA